VGANNLLALESIDFINISVQKLHSQALPYENWKNRGEPKTFEKCHRYRELNSVSVSKTTIYALFNTSV